MAKDIHIGNTATGERVFVHIELRPLERTMQTVNHEKVDGGLRLSISGETYRGSSCVGAGQNLGDLLRVTKPHGKWTLDQIKELHDIWDQWHLNDMRAGCVHQTVVVKMEGRYGTQVDLDATTKANDCPEGYAYGSAWLYEPLPQNIVDRVRQFQLRAVY